MEKLPQTFVARAALIASLSALSLTSCAAEAPQPSPIEEAVKNFDSDQDGAPNAVDPYPDVANPTDWDVDGIPNGQDTSPYTAQAVSSGSVDTPVTQPPTTTNNQPNTNTGSTQQGCVGDKDCDTIPDYKDPYPNIYDPSDRQQPEDDDLDDDGLPNGYDSAPQNRDRDMDGKLDGYDPDPNNPNDGTNESTDNNPYIDDKDGDGDGYDDVLDSEPNDPYEN